MMKILNVLLFLFIVFVSNIIGGNVYFIYKQGLSTIPLTKTPHMIVKEQIFTLNYSLKRINLEIDVGDLGSSFSNKLFVKNIDNQYIGYYLYKRNITILTNYRMKIFKRVNYLIGIGVGLYFYKYNKQEVGDIYIWKINTYENYNIKDDNNITCYFPEVALKMELKYDIPKTFVDIGIELLYQYGFVWENEKNDLGLFFNIGCKLTDF